MNETVIALLIFLAAVTGIAAIGHVLRDIFRMFAPKTTKPTYRILRRNRKQAESESAGAVGRFDHWLSRLTIESGLRWSPITSALAVLFVGLILGGIFFLWFEKPMPALLGVLIGMPLPLMVLSILRGRRITLMQDQLAPSLDMLARSVRAGESLDQAMSVVGAHAPEPLAAEFRWCSRQLDLGLALPAVMRALVDRVRLSDVRIFTTTLTVHRQTGGNVAKLLERLANVIRDRLMYRRQLRVATALGRSSAMVVSLMGPLVFAFFFLFRPEYIQALLGTPLGQTLLAIAVVLEIVGIIWMMRLSKPSY